MTCVATIDEAWKQLLYEDGTKRPGCPHLIISDYFMGIESGYDFLQQLKHDERFQAIPTVFLSASDAPELILDAYRLGACGWLLKDDKIDQTLHALMAYWLRGAIPPEA